MIRIKAKIALSIKDRGIGLIGHAKVIPMLFLTRFGIHTFGMKLPIDILILDSENIVVKLKKSLPPNNIFFWPLKFNKVLELPGGFIDKNRIRIGSKISLKMVQ